MRSIDKVPLQAQRLGVATQVCELALRYLVANRNCELQPRAGSDAVWDLGVTTKPMVIRRIYAMDPLRWT